MGNTAFSRYAPFIQEYIYRKGWEDLRQVQVDACNAILDGDGHVIISAGTASGKTEAAFFPILSLLDRDPPKSVGVMYIGPLKALINDQFQRLEELLQAREIPVWPWHGDVSQSVKKRALAAKEGVLQITPESLEALLMGKPREAKELLCDLRFVVIDEIHALMGADRGLQMLCLLERLEKLAGCRPRRVGLSATLHDYGPALAFLRGATDREAVAVDVSGGKRRLSLCAQCYSLPEDGDEGESARAEMNTFLYDHSHKKKCIIFTGSRGAAEETVSSLRAIAQRRQEPDVFHVHHGSLSAATRREAELALKEGTGPTVAAATLTLELGIDIGKLDSVIQVGAPYTVSSFVQRLGRSGRRTGVSQMMFVCPWKRQEPGTPEDLPWELLRSIAVIQLYVEERWVEPFEKKPKPFSLLAHQTLSTLMSQGELSPADLARLVLPLAPFRDTVTQQEYRDLLRYMLREEYLGRMDGGGLIVGLRAEPIVNHYSFYAVFPEEESYRVLTKEGEIGTLTRRPQPGGTFVLAGGVWQAAVIDDNRKVIHATAAHGQAAASWEGSQGDIHSRVIARVKQVLQEDVVYPYLLPQARAALAEARTLARKLGILEERVIKAGGNTLLLFPWTGTRQVRTMESLLRWGLSDELLVTGVSENTWYLTVHTGHSPQSFRQAAGHLSPTRADPALVLSREDAPEADKYDYMIPPELRRMAWLHNQMDLPGAVEVLRNL